MSAVDDLPAEAGAGNELPIGNYTELTVARVLPLLAGLSRAQLWQIHEYEHRHRTGWHPRNHPAGSGLRPGGRRRNGRH